MLVVNSRIRIPDEELQFTFVRSSGPGGQNVNKVASKASLRWNVAASAALADDVRKRFLERIVSLMWVLAIRFAVLLYLPIYWLTHRYFSVGDHNSTLYLLAGVGTETAYQLLFYWLLGNQVRAVARAAT